MLHSVLCLLFVCGIGAAEEEDGATEDAGSFVEITPKLEAAVEHGLSWLARNQAPDGSWGADGFSGQYQMAMTGLAGLALLSAGHFPGRGRYGSNVQRALHFILKHQDHNGLFTCPSDAQQMYGHGFAMTFLAEAYGMSGDGELGASIKQALARAVKVTQQAQSSRGGWYYSPNPSNDEGSVTITQVMALRSVRNVGIDVPYKVLEQAIEYIRKSQNSDGGLRYSLQSSQTSSVALTAAGANVLMLAGQYRGSQTQRACDYLKKNLDPRHTQGYHDFYTNFYGSQAMFQLGGEYWARYFELMRGRLLKSQGADGSWSSEIGRTYCTAIGVMILCLPYRYLPILQK